jgi:heterodisulfide reductase subunit C
VSYYIHDLTFFFFLCFLPLGKHFHVITSLFNVFFMRIDRGNIKPVVNGITDDQLDDLESFGVKRLEDFTWKHMLDFYSCADCGRCSDNCPANAVGRPLSPRFISIKGRDLMFKNYPIYPYGSPFKKSDDLIGTTFEEDEIWSCTTCGACEQECPIGIEYIDKIVDLRRGMVDEGMVPQSLQKPLKALEKRGNPWGKMEKKRADWTKDLPGDVTVKDLAKKDSPRHSTSWTALPPMTTGCRRSAGPQPPFCRVPVRISAFWAKWRKTAATRSADLAKRCCFRPSRRPIPMPS